MNDVLVISQEISNVVKKQLWFEKIIGELSTEQDKEMLSEVLVNRAIGIYMSIENTQERDVFLQLINDIDVLVFSDYSRLINKCYGQLRKKYPEVKNFYITPLLKKKDSETGKVKSGLFVSYLFNSYQFSLIDQAEELPHAKIKIKRFLDEATLNRIFLSNDSILVFVDDFVGTGNSVRATYNSYFETCSEEWKKKTCLLTLTILDIGLGKLNDLEIPTIFGAEYLSLSSKYNDNPKKVEDIKKTMKNISRKFKISKKYFYGYNNCLSTVVTIHSQNNNIPFLWSSKINKQKPLFIRNE